MKSINAICLYVEERNAALCRTFNRMLDSDGYSDINRVFDELASQPAPRFYISEDRALLLLRNHRRTGRWALKKPERIAMLEEINARVERVLKENPGLGLYDAVCCVVNSPAPSFYITPGTARTYVYCSLTR